MRRIPIIALLPALLFVISGCGSSLNATEYLSLPFTAVAKVTIESSEYVVSISKGGANLVSVTVESPEALSGMTAILGEDSALEYRGSRIEHAFPRTVAELVYDAFCDANRIEAYSDGDVEVVRFASARGSGSVRIDGFSAVPMSLESEDVNIEFTEFNR